MNRLGHPVSDAAGCSIEVTGRGENRRVSLRAWHQRVDIPAFHIRFEEFAQALGLQIPAKKAPRKPLSWKERLTGKLRGEEVGA